jgi:VWFA-related protein
MPSRHASLALALFLTLGPVSSAQRSPDSSDQSATIHSTTRLVQISVVALDNHGNPITGLTKDNFTVTDEGRPQKISVFSAESPTPNAPVQPLPSNVFTNRFDLKGQDPGAVTIILFDALNTSSPDQSYARKQILKFLQSLPPQDHVALYALTTRLYRLHDFTHDSAALVNAVNHFSVEQTAAFEASTTAFIDLVSITGDPDWAGGGPENFQASLNNANGIIADQALLNRSVSTASAIEAIANHVAVVPGRKSLVWVSGGFPLQIGLDHLGRADRISQSVAPDVQHAIRALNHANVSIYPIDVHGVEVSTGIDPAQRDSGSGTGVDSSFFNRQNSRDTFRDLADRTGGVAFYGNNDISAGIRRAFDDGRFAYTIGFYPDHNTWDGKFREIKIKSTAPDVQLRYRKGYFAVSERSDSADEVKLDLEEAAVSPLNSTSLGIVVVGKPAGAADDRNLELRMNLDPKQFLLHDAAGHHTGALDMMFMQNAPNGEVLAAEKQHFEVNFDDQQYAYLSSVGIILLRHIKIAPQASQIRVIVRDAASGALGSVSMPVNAFYPSGTPVS